MKVLTFSRHFPKDHPKAGQPTWFVEKIEACLADTIPGWEMSKTFTLHEWLPYYNCTLPKHHTIRPGNRFKPGDMVSLRVWSGAPYRSKQIEFAQVEVKKVWPVEIYVGELIVEIIVDNISQNIRKKKEVALNDGLELIDFVNWFKIHPKAKRGISFQGQIICWNESIEYNK